MGDEGGAVPDSPTRLGHGEVEEATNMSNRPQNTPLPIKSNSRMSTMDYVSGAATPQSFHRKRQSGQILELSFDEYFVCFTLISYIFPFPGNPKLFISGSRLSAVPHSETWSWRRIPTEGLRHIFHTSYISPYSFPLWFWRNSIDLFIHHISSRLLI